MQINESRRAAKTVVEEFDLADEDTDYDYYHALLDDERFAAAAYLYQEAGVYAASDDATEADREARDCLKRSLREHAQRVRGEVPAGEEDDDE
ncbi:hypothetical protein [Halobellus rufus]|uniref:hypothetical protein n=1 Tax=Halobellus rufus TaxID=1448860 RepID=UPI0006793E4C|nr:hypothetical protein [Halobellus rufus]